MTATYSRISKSAEAPISSKTSSPGAVPARREPSGAGHADVRCQRTRRLEMQMEARGGVGASRKEYLWFSFFLSIYVCNKLTLIQLASIVFISSEAIIQAAWGIQLVTPHTCVHLPKSLWLQPGKLFTVRIPEPFSSY